MERLTEQQGEKPKGLFGDTFKRRYAAFRLRTLEPDLRQGRYDHGRVQIARDRVHTVAKVWREEEDDTLEELTVKITKHEITQKVTRINVSLVPVDEESRNYPPQEASVTERGIEGDVSLLGRAVKDMRYAAKTSQTLPPDRIARQPELN